MATVNNGEPHQRGWDAQPKVRGDDSAMNEKGRRRDSLTSEGGKGKVDKTPASKFVWKMPLFLAWVPVNWTWTKVRSAARCTMVVWISALLFIIPTAKHILGRVSNPFSLCILYPSVR